MHISEEKPHPDLDERENDPALVGVLLFIMFVLPVLLVCIGATVLWWIAYQIQQAAPFM